MEHPIVDAPEGAPTFVFTDIEASSALWEAVPEAMARALRAHDALMFCACSARKGYVVKAEGDAFMIAFETAEDAINFALLAQQALARLSWPMGLEREQAKRGVIGPLGLRVRIGIHQGEAEQRTNQLTGRSDYFGSAVNIAARLCDMAHGAQVLVSGETLKQCAPPEATVVTLLGATPVRGMKQTVRVYQTISAAWWPIDFPPLRLGRVQTHDEAGKPKQRADLTTEMEAVADQLFTRAQIDRFAGRLEDARYELRAHQAVVEWLGDDERMAEGLLEFSAADSNQGAYEAALGYTDEVLAILDGGRYPTLHCRALIQKSVRERFLYRFETARKSGEKAYAASLKQDDERITARARATLAELDRMEGNFESAETGMRAALKALESHDDRSSLRGYYAEFGMFLVELGRSEGLEILRRVAKEYEGLNMVLSAASTWINLSLYHLDHGDPKLFNPLNDKACAAFGESGNRDAEAACILNRAFMHLVMGDLHDAHADLLQAGKQFAINFEPETDLEAGTLHAWLAYLLGDVSMARKGSDYFAAEAPKVRQLLGPMTLQVQEILAALLDDDLDLAADLIASKEPPASVTYRVIWRSMNAHIAARRAD